MGPALFSAVLFAVVFVAGANAASSFTQAALTLDSSTGAGSYFGTSISISGNLVAVGWPQANMFNLVYEYYHDSGEPATSGNGYVSLYNCSTASCTFATHFMPTVAVPANAMFGSSVTLGASGTFLLIGAPRSEIDIGSDEPWTGSIAMYSCPSPTTCTEVGLPAKQGYEYGYYCDGCNYNGMFGMSTAVAQTATNTLIAFVGSPTYSHKANGRDLCGSGSCGIVMMYEMTRSGTTWSFSSVSYMFYEHTDFGGTSIAAAPTSYGAILVAGDPGESKNLIYFCVFPNCTVYPYGINNPTSTDVGMYNTLYVSQSTALVAVGYYAYNSNQGEVAVYAYACPTSLSTPCTLGQNSTLTVPFLSSIQSNDFGFSVNGYGNTLIVSAPNFYPPEIYLYSCTVPTATATPVSCAILSVLPTAPESVVTSTGAGFGYFVAVGPNFAAVGAPFASNSAADQGAVYLYSCGTAATGSFPTCTAPGPATSTVTTTATNFVDSTTGTDFYLGTSISVAGTLVYVGSPMADMHSATTSAPGASIANTGYVTVYNCAMTASALCSSASVQRFDGNSAANSDLFGASLAAAASGNVNGLVVGAPGYSSFEGIMYIYSCAITSPYACTYVTSTAGASASRLGFTTAASYVSNTGFLFFAGAPKAKTFYYMYCAAASTATSFSSCVSKTAIASAVSSTAFGQALTAVGSTVVVGDPAANFATIWTCTTGSSVTCTEYTTTKVAPYSALGGTTFYNMSMSVSSSNMLAIGVPQAFGYRGAFYVYSCAVSIATPTCSASPSFEFLNSAGSSFDQFGQSLAFVGTVLAVAVPGQASVYIYVCSSASSCTLTGPIVPQATVSSVSVTSGFGYSITMDSNTNFVAVGNPYGSPTDSYQGSFVVISCINYFRADLPLCKATATASATESYTHSATASYTMSATGSYTHSATGSFTKSATGSLTQSATGSYTKSATGSYTNSVTESYTKSATDSATHSATQSHTASGTDSATFSATASATGSFTASATGSFTESATGSFTESATGSFTESATESFTNSATVSFTHTPSPTASYTHSFTHSATTRLHLTFTTYSESATESFTESATPTLSYTASLTASATNSDTASKTHSDTASHTKSRTDSVTASATPSATQSYTHSFTESATNSFTASASNSFTESATNSLTESATVSATASATVSATASATGSSTASATDSFTESATNSFTQTATASAANSFTETATASAAYSFTGAATASATNSLSETAVASATASATSTFAAIQATTIGASISTAAPSAATTVAPSTQQTPTPVAASTMFYYNTHFPTGPGQQPQLTLVLSDAASRRRAGFTMVANVTLVACSNPGFFATNFALPSWLTLAQVTQLAVQFSSINTTTGLTDYADGPNCNPSTPNNYYVGIVPPPGYASLLSSPTGCNGSFTPNFGTNML